MSRHVAWPWRLAAYAILAAAVEARQRPACMMAESFLESVDAHLDDWDRQIDVGLNESLNCSEFLEFLYLSRDTIRTQLDYAKGNFTAQDDAFQAGGEQGESTTWAISHLSTASSLLSAHLHIHGVLSAARTDCLSEHLQLLFLMSLKSLKSVLHSQLRQLWVVFQGTAELVRQGAGKYLAEAVDLFEADLRTIESIMASWVPPLHERQALAAREGQEDKTGTIAMDEGEVTTPPPEPLRPGPPLPRFTEREPDRALSTVEILRRDAFAEWDVQKPLLRALLRHVLPRDSVVGDFCAGSGLAATWLNDTGLVVAHAFDASPNVNLLSKGTVAHAMIHTASLGLWRNFDIVLCLTASTDLGVDESAWSQLWRNVEAHATRGAVLACGQGEARQRVLAGAELHAPGLRHDAALGERLALVGEPGAGVCVFWRKPDA